MEAQRIWAGWGLPKGKSSDGATGSIAGGQAAGTEHEISCRDRFARDNPRLASARPASSGRVIVGGLTGWLLTKLRREGRPRPQLAVLERITLAPRQSLTLIEASGQRLLVATSADGTPAFYPVGGAVRQTQVQGKPPARVSLGRVSW